MSVLNESDIARVIEIDLDPDLEPEIHRTTLAFLVGMNIFMP